ITVQASDRMQGGNFAIERSAAPLPPQRLPERSAVNMDWGFEGDGVEEEERPDFAPQPEEEGEGRRSRRRRRRGRRDGREEARASAAKPEPVAEAEMSSPDTPQAEPPWDEIEPAAAAATEPPGVGEQPSIPDGPRAPGDDEREERRGRRGRRRGRRGGRRGRDRDGQRAHTEEARD